SQFFPLVQLLFVAGSVFASLLSLHRLPFFRIPVDQLCSVYTPILYKCHICWYNVCKPFLFASIKNAIKYHKHVLELTDLICHTSFFEFEGKTYLQGWGVPMGSPMSAVLCELVLRKLESNILPSFQNDIIVYARYVDDIFVLRKNNRNTHRFISLINNNPYGLTIELDQESKNSVNFLDLTITCKEGEIKTNIYRKPVYQPIIIPKNSSDPEHIKLAAFRSWITRAYTHCTSIYDTHKELEYIRSIAEQQG
ncbi:uncharacterized protein LOC111616739, partial [Centruroides sculpturatus]|uniref:uncharacterized protein LOC111616739 n=1 Tax=Centruroides sculpturatus TaxID=218467 RepID=UPI000C6E74AA